MVPSIQYIVLRTKKLYTRLGHLFWRCQCLLNMGVMESCTISCLLCFFILWNVFKFSSQDTCLDLGPKLTCDSKRVRGTSTNLLVVSEIEVHHYLRDQAVPRAEHRPQTPDISDNQNCGHNVIKRPKSFEKCASRLLLIGCWRVLAGPSYGNRAKLWSPTSCNPHWKACKPITLWWLWGKLGKQ